MVSNQSHLDGNLSRRRVPVWAHQEESAVCLEPFVVDTLQHKHWIIQVFQHMRQHDVVIPLRQSCLLKKRIDELHLVAQPLPSFLNSNIRCFDTSDVVEIWQESFSEVSFQAPQFKQTPHLKERLERFDHEGMHDIEVETVCVFVT